MKCSQPIASPSYASSFEQWVNSNCNRRSSDLGYAPCQSSTRCIFSRPLIAVSEKSSLAATSGTLSDHLATKGLINQLHSADAKSEKTKKVGFGTCIKSIIQISVLNLLYSCHCDEILEIQAWLELSLTNWGSFEFFISHSVVSQFRSLIIVPHSQLLHMTRVVITW